MRLIHTTRNWYFQQATVRKTNAAGTNSDYLREMTALERNTLLAYWNSNRFTIDPSLPAKSTDTSITCGVNNSSGWRHGNAAFISGSDNSPRYEIVLEPLREGRSNDDYCKRVRNGEMVLSPYARRDVEFKLTNGVTVSNSKDLDGQCLIPPDMLNTHGPWTMYKSGWRNGFFNMGGGLLASVTVYMKRQRSDVTFNVSPFAFGLTSQEVKDKFDKPITPQVDPAWVQSVHADANSRCVDWLTTVAELPETLKSIFSAMRSIAGLLKGWKGRERSVKQQFNQYVAQLKKRIADTTEMLSKAKAKTLLRKLRQKLKKLNKEYSRRGKTLIDWLANAWMTYRYGIMPYVYLIKDVTYAAKKELHKKQYLTTRDDTIVKFDAPALAGYSFSGTAECEVKMMIKYMYEPYLSKISDLARVASANIALTTFELARKSFVWDWFFTFGDALSAGFGTPGDAVDTASTLSFKTTIRGTYVHSSSGATINVNYSSYTRTIPDLGSFRGVYFRPNLTWKRLVDAFAMTWPALKRSIK